MSFLNLETIRDLAHNLKTFWMTPGTISFSYAAGH